MRRTKEDTLTGVSPRIDWYDVNGATSSYAWFHSNVQRGGSIRTVLPVFFVNSNRQWYQEYFESVRCWERRSERPESHWVKALQAGDVINILPRTTFRGWVNPIRSASIDIKYEVWSETERDLWLNQQSIIRTNQEQENQEFYNRVLKSDEAEIRILVVEPDLEDEPIICSFDYAKINKKDLTIPQPALPTGKTSQINGF
ncbi:hypothetical protein F4825DRAFT_473453 [Nemania diffusa]|nr:hypothetical protein F4825DRAFT_473453 [Nemania diffusa]